MSSPSPAPTPSRRAPLASTPVSDYLATAARPGVSVDSRYLVLPRIVLEHLPPSIQHELVYLLSRIHQITGELSWPESYRVEAARWQTISTLDETGLRELGVTAELDWNGDLIHRDNNTGCPLAAAELTRPTSVACPDPLYAQYRSR